MASYLEVRFTSERWTFNMFFILRKRYGIFIPQAEKGVPVYAQEKALNRHAVPED